MLLHHMTFATMPDSSFRFDVIGDSNVRLFEAMSSRMTIIKSAGFALISDPVSSNVELTGAARLYRAASSDRRERG